MANGTTDDTEAKSLSRSPSLLYDLVCRCETNINYVRERKVRTPVPRLLYPINDCFSIKIVNQRKTGCTGRVSSDKVAAGHKLQRDLRYVRLPTAGCNLQDEI